MICTSSFLHSKGVGVVSPITPNEALRAKVARYPVQVFEVFNRLLTEGSGYKNIHVSEDAVVDTLVASGLNLKDISVNR